jgi:hypothetical protein
MNPTGPPYKNRVLAALPKAEIARLTPHLSKLTLKQEQTLADGNPKYAYFLEQGIASVVATVEDGTTVEIGVIGVDGVVGIPILLGSTGVPGRTFVQIEGSGFRIPATVLKAEFERAGTLREHLQKYIQAFLVQTAQTAVCNRLHIILRSASRAGY